MTRTAPAAAWKPWAAAAVFVVPLLWNNRHFWRHALSPGGLDAASLHALLRHGAVPVACAALVVLLAAGAGARLWRVLGRGEPPGPAVSFALGTGALGLAVFALGLAGSLGRGPLLAALAAAGLFAAPEFPLLATRANRLRLPSPSAASWLLAAVLALSAWHTLVLALAPAAEWDVLLYHLAIPKLYLRLGRIEEIPWLLYSHWPHLMEVLYAVPLALGDDAVPALVHLAASWLLVACVYKAAADASGETAGLAAAALVAAQPAFLRLAGTAHSDGAFALFHFLGSLALWRWSRGESRSWLVLAGLLAGLAASTKLVGASLLAAGGVLAWFSSRRSQGRAWADAGLYLLCGTAVVLPWYLKTALGAGNPVWPMFSAWLGGRWGAGLVEPLYARSSQWPWPLEWARLIRWGPQYLLGPLAGLALLAGLAGRGLGLPRRVRFNLLPLALYLPLVIRYEDAWRYLLPFYPALAMAAACWASRLAEKRGALRAAAVALLGFGLWPVFTASQNNELFAVAGARSRLEPGREARELYLERTLDHYRAFRRLAGSLPRGSRVLFVREGRGYYFEGDYQWGDPLTQGLIDYAGLGAPDALAGRLRELGITHVLVNEVLAADPGAVRSYDPRFMPLVRSFLERRARLVAWEAPIAVYGVGP